MLNTARGIISSDATTQEMIAPVIDTLVATKNYSVGEEFIYAGTLYRFKAEVSIGDTIIINGSEANAELALPITDQSYVVGDAFENDIADNDYIPFFDISAVKKRKSLWSNIKAKLKAYFDPEYKDYTISYRSEGTNTKAKITINDSGYWMICFVVTIYSSYRAQKIMVSGYKYGSQHWYLPRAVTLGDTSNDDVSVYFGYDDDNTLWVGFDVGMYTAIRIDQVANAYSIIADISKAFTVTFNSSLSGTTQITVTAKKPTYQ